MQEIEHPGDDTLEQTPPAASGRAKTLLIGAGIGALTGLAAAFLLSRRASKEDGEISVTPGEGIRIGLLVLGLLRSIASLGGEEK